MSAEASMETRPSSSADLWKAVENRRSYYNITSESTLSNAQLQELVEKAVKYAPCSFNMQQCRAVLLTGKKHREVWELVKKNHLATLSDEGQKAYYTNKFDNENAVGYGTVLFFEDQAVLKEWQGKMPFLSDAFARWSDNSAGMLQFITWSALAAEGLGGNLQHYAGMNPKTQSELTELLGVSSEWICSALLPFGKPTGPPGNPSRPKEFAPIEDRVKTFFD